MGSRELSLHSTEVICIRSRFMQHQNQNGHNYQTEGYRIGVAYGLTNICYIKFCYQVEFLILRFVVDY